MGANPLDAAASSAAGGETIKRKHAICYQQILGLYLCE